MGQFRTWFFGKYPLPLVVEPSNPDMSLEEALDLIQKHAPSFRERLLQSGGILFRQLSHPGSGRLRCRTEKPWNGRILQLRRRRQPQKESGRRRLHLHRGPSLDQAYPAQRTLLCEKLSQPHPFLLRCRPPRKGSDDHRRRPKDLCGNRSCRKRAV